MEKFISKEQLKILASTDNLTKLKNLYYLKHNFANYLLENKVVYLMMIDFRKLKYINDKLGHEVGDICLKSFSNLIQKYFDDDILVRKSGDEFVIVSNNRLNTIKSKFNSIKNDIAREYKNELLPIIYGFNVGVTKCDGVNSLKDYIKEADAAMYDAKSRDIMFEVYDIKHLEKIDYEKKLLKKFKDALDNNKLDFQYQPIYYNNGKRIFSIEYLLRLNNNPVFDNKSYSLLKKNYFMEKMDNYSFNKIINNIEDINYFIDKKLTITINIHSQTINYLNAQHFSLIKQQLKLNKIDPKRIYIDIHMDDEIENIDEVISKIITIKSLGFNICLDNVSISSKNPLILYILKIPMNIIKICKETLVEALEDKNAKKILDGIVKIMNEMDVVVVFNKIENKKEYDFVKKHYPKALIQGYFLEKPMNISDIKNKIK
jgi:diguanylate cyclase (GGDEF)-like protein